MPGRNRHSLTWRSRLSVFIATAAAAALAAFESSPPDRSRAMASPPLPGFRADGSARAGPAVRRADASCRVRMSPRWAKRATARPTAVGLSAPLAAASSSCRGEPAGRRGGLRRRWRVSPSVRCRGDAVTFIPDSDAAAVDLLVDSAVCRLSWLWLLPRGLLGWSWRSFWLIRNRRPGRLE